MKRNIITLALVLLLCLSTMPYATAAAPAVHPDKTNYEEGETIFVTVVGITEQMESDGSFIAIYKTGAPHEEYGAWEYVPAGDSQLELTAPEYGTYEIRLYSKDGEYTDDTYVTKAAFSVGGAVISDKAKILLDKTVYAAGERIIVTAGGITQQMEEDDAFIAIYESGAEHGQWKEFHYPKRGESQLEFTAPEEKGAYEMRLYRKDGEYTDETFVLSVSFTVGAVTVDNPGRIELDGDAYLANSVIQVRVTGITEQMEKDGAFAAIYQKGAKHNEWGAYDYPKAGDSILELRTPNLNGEFEIRLYSMDHFYSEATFVMSVPFTLSGASDPQGSGWATEELKKAEELRLIPESLRTADLARPITRAEFAAVAVKLYEAMSGEMAQAGNNPFADTNDPEVLKAYALGITKGTSETAFEPDLLISREQVATMLTRTVMAGRNISILNQGAPITFADSEMISDWARESVQFMAGQGIIKGVEENGALYFRPNNRTDAQAAQNYANATREQALAISVRSFETIK